MNNQYTRAISRLITLKPKFLESPSRLLKIKSVLNNFGSPEKSQNKYIHVAGTNGKGSVSMKIARALQLSGYKTGLFTSPHLFSYTERMKINNKPIPRHRFLQTFNKISTYINQYELNYFEVATIMAFIYYMEEECDKIVLEVGLGGLIDATNIIEHPVLSVITSIGLDHTEILGDSLHSIAKQKAGIIKPGRPVVIGANCFPETVFQEKAKSNGSPLHKVKNQKYPSFEDQNNALIKEVFKVLQNEKIFLDQKAKQRALEAKQQCRRQYILSQSLPIHNQKNKNKVILDVGHNPPALKKLLQTVKIAHPNQNYYVIYGTSGQKDSTSSINAIREFTQKIYLIEAKHFRAMSVSQLKRNSLGMQGVSIISDGDIHSTIQHVLQLCNQGDIVVICGSFFIMGQAKGFFYPQQIRKRLDPPVIPVDK